MNMIEVYRNEISALTQAERGLLRDQKRHDTACERQIRLLARDRDRRHRADAAALDRIHKRRAILQGRIGS